jgi:hypothetical protein
MSAGKDARLEDSEEKNPLMKTRRGFWAFGKWATVFVANANAMEFTA